MALLVGFFFVEFILQVHRCHTAPTTRLRSSRLLIGSKKGGRRIDLFFWVLPSIQTNFTLQTWPTLLFGLPLQGCPTCQAANIVQRCLHPGHSSFSYSLCSCEGLREWNQSSISARQSFLDGNSSLIILCLMYVSCTSVCFSIAKRGACIWRKGREHAKAYMHVPVNVCQNQFCWIIKSKRSSRPKPIF